MQRGATECSAKFGKSGREILEMSEKPMKQSNKQISLSSGGSTLKMGKKVTDGETKHCHHT
jgi:hypothetical protein